MASITTTLIGILLLFYSVRVFVRWSRAKVIAEFMLVSEGKNVFLNSKKRYSLCFLGAGFVSDKGKIIVELKSTEGKLIPLHKTLPNYRFRRNGTIGLEYWYFNIEKDGIYNLNFVNINDLIIKDSMLISKRIFQKNRRAEDLKILLKESISIRSRLLAIICLVIGINALLWGILIN